MSLDRILDPLAARLGQRLGPGTRVDDVLPSTVGDLPCVVLTLDEGEQALMGVGRAARGTRQGALELTVRVDLADPVLDLGDGETLDLLSADRRTLTLPHGPVVRADGTEQPPFEAGDVTADDGAPFTVVSGEPVGRSVRVDPAAGALQFGVALVATGTLVATYHVGRWDVSTTRVQGLLTVRTIAARGPQARSTTRRVAEALDAPDPGVRLTPVSWGAVTPGTIGDDDDVHEQQIGFGIDAEVEEPVLTSGGGVITTVHVTGTLPAPGSPNGGADGDPFEPFDVTRGVTT